MRTGLVPILKGDLLMKKIIGIGIGAVLCLSLTGVAFAYHASVYHGKDNQVVVVHSISDDRVDNSALASEQDDVAVGDVINEQTGEMVFAINENGSYITMVP